MSAKVELTLEQLARIALGVPELTNVNVAVLHSLLNVVMKKLDCQNELVTIGGFESKCMEKILEQSKMSPLPFNDDEIVPISGELDKVAVLEKRIVQLEAKLQRHFDQIRMCNKVNSKRYPEKLWEKYAAPCEDLCTVCDEDNRIACSLLHNTDFMQKLMRTIAMPILEMVEETNHKLSKFYQTLEAFLAKLQKLFHRVELIRECIKEIESLREMIDQQKLLFIGTMEELQDMLDAKLDKMHMPALKKYMRDRFDDLDRRLSVIETKEACPRAAGFINSGICCLSCGNTNVGVDVGPSIMPDIPNATPHKNAIVPTHCSDRIACRNVEKEPTIMVRINNLDLTALSQRMTRGSNAKNCKLPEQNTAVYGLRHPSFTSR